MINHCFFLCYYLIKFVGILHFLDIAMREFFAGLKKKPCDDVDMVTATVLEYWNKLVADYWSLMMSLVQSYIWQ